LAAVQVDRHRVALQILAVTPVRITLLVALVVMPLVVLRVV